jgi:hypothetical protein
MQRERYPRDDPREWLSRARSSLALARSAAEGVDLEDLCFEAQQDPGADQVPTSVYDEAIEIAETVVMWAAERINMESASSE